jgi:hypothetical protein
VFDDGRVLDTLEQLTTDAAKHAAAPVWSLPDAELIDCLDAAHRLERAATAIRHHLVRQIDARDIPSAQGHRSTASWLRSRLLLDPQLANLVLLCRRHHRLVHRGDWRVRPGPDHLPEFLPPAHIDPDQRPRRNPYHPRT